MRGAQILRTPYRYVIPAKAGIQASSTVLLPIVAEIIFRRIGDKEHLAFGLTDSPHTTSYNLPPIFLQYHLTGCKVNAYLF